MKKIGDDQMLQRLLLGALLVSGLDSAARAEPIAPCVRHVALTMSSIYACQRIVSYHAETADLTDRIVMKRRTADLKVIFGSNESPEICGSLRFNTPEFDKTNVGAADAVLVLQKRANDAFIEADPQIQQQSYDIADSFIDAPSEQTNETRTHALHNIDTAINEIDRKMQTAVGEKVLTAYAPNLCGAIVSNVGISLPSVLGPDLAELAKYKKAAANYAKFSDWLNASQLAKQSDK